MESGAAQTGSLGVQLAGALGEQIELLREIADNPGSGLQTVAVSDTEVQPGIQIGFPYPGMDRILIPRQTAGGEYALTETPTLILPENNRRIGFLVTNPSEGEVVLVLGEPAIAKASGGHGIVRLAERQSWNGLIGSALWCGNVSARVITGSGVVAVTEV